MLQPTVAFDIESEVARLAAVVVHTPGRGTPPWFMGAKEELYVTIRGSELSRGRGGPRCMTMRLARVSE